MFFVLSSISIYISGIYLILVLSNCNAIQSTDCHVRYFNKLSISISLRGSWNTRVNKCIMTISVFLVVIIEKILEDS